MNPGEVRRLAKEMAHYAAFISLNDDIGGSDTTLVAVKDNIDVQGMVTTAGGLHLPMTPAEIDAPVVAAVKRAGGTVIGKCNLHEYALGVTNGNPHYGIARNPCDPDRIPGGSSGGSAVAVGLGLCDWAIGTDTGGSVRIPAGLCGVAGLKPTTGRLSIAGIFPVAESLDTPGPMARDVRTIGRAMDMLTGTTGFDPGPPRDWAPALAVPSGWEDDLDQQTTAVWRQVTSALPRIDFPSWKDLEDAFQPILFYELMSHHLKWYSERPELYGEDVRGMFAMGTKISVSGYEWGIAQRDRLREEFERAMGDFDAVLLPTTAIVAPLIGETGIREKLLRYQRPVSLAGHPAISIPGPSKGLPVGIQIVGHHGEDAALLRVASALEARWGSRGTI